MRYEIQKGVTAEMVRPSERMNAGRLTNRVYASEMKGRERLRMRRKDRVREYEVERDISMKQS